LGVFALGSGLCRRWKRIFSFFSKSKNKIFFLRRVETSDDEGDSWPVWFARGRTRGLFFLFEELKALLRIPSNLLIRSSGGWCRRAAGVVFAGELQRRLDGETFRLIETNYAGANRVGIHPLVDCGLGLQCQAPCGGGGWLKLEAEGRPVLFAMGI